MNWIIETPATTLALSLIEAKRHLRIATTDTSFDDLITDYIKAAQELLRTETSIFPVAQSYVGSMLNFVDITINYYPIVTIDSIRYKDVNGNEQTMTLDTDYRQNIVSSPSVIIFDESPELEDENLAPISIRFTTGYAAVPEDVKQALRMIVADMFEMPQSSAFGVTVNDMSRQTEQYLMNISHRLEL